MNKESRKRKTLKKDLAFFLGFGTIGTALFTFSAISIYNFIKAIIRRDSVILWDEASWIALPTSISFLMLAACFYIGRHHGSNVSGRHSDIIKYLVAFTAFVLPFIIIFPLSMHWITAMHLEDRGYIEHNGRLWIKDEQR